MSHVYCTDDVGHFDGAIQKIYCVKKSMETKSKKEFEDVLQAPKYLPCISLIMPFEPKLGLKKELDYKLKIACDKIEKEINARHTKAYIHESNLGLPLEIGGDYRWRRDGEDHVVNPTSIASLQQAVRQNKPESYATFAKMINDQNEKIMTLRGLFEFSSFC